MNPIVHCRVSVPHLHRKFIRIEATYPADAKELILQLPVWRPGRYEQADFARNIRAWAAHNADGDEVDFRKTGLSTWRVDTAGSPEITVSYEFYANVLNAGSSFVDEDLLYINPVNCFMYVPERPGLSYQVELDIPAGWTTASGMETEGNNILKATDFQQLADRPILSSPNLAHLKYLVGNTVFHLRVYGEMVMDRNRIVDDFTRFTEAQIRAFGRFPEPEYHFLLILTPWAHYHGVEHENSTVIVLGPSSGITEGRLYEELLGVSSHELYHTWNVKKIRPKEMQPYDFSMPALSELGFVTEGVTTYFGDQFLHRSGIFSDEQYFRALEKLVDRHFDNPGRANYSVAESSFDTWLDGYSAGIPWRKVSIYNEGALCALMADVHIIKQSSCRKSLDDAMQSMDSRFGMSGRGYSEADYKQALEECSGADFSWLFERYVYGREDYFPALLQVFDYLGIELSMQPSEKPWEAWLGMRLNDNLEIMSVLPESPADKAGLWTGMKLLSWNGHALNTARDWAASIKSTEKAEISFSHNGKVSLVLVEPVGNPQYRRHHLRLREHPGEEKERIFRFWKFRRPLE